MRRGRLMRTPARTELALVSEPRVRHQCSAPGVKLTALLCNEAIRSQPDRLSITLPFTLTSLGRLVLVLRQPLHNRHQFSSDL